MARTGPEPSTPKLSYFDAMRIELIPGRLACQMQADEFEAWLDMAIQRASDPEAIRAKLKGSDYLFFADRWHAMLTLIESGSSLQEARK